MDNINKTTKPTAIEPNEKAYKNREEEGGKFAKPIVTAGIPVIISCIAVAAIFLLLKLRPENQFIEIWLNISLIMTGIFWIRFFLIIFHLKEKQQAKE